MENILDNAFRYTPSGGRIEIDQREVGPDVEIRIGNSGRAIPVAARAQRILTRATAIEAKEAKVRDAFAALADQKASGAIKVAFDFR